MISKKYFRTLKNIFENIRNMATIHVINILVLYLVLASEKVNIYHSSPRKQYSKIIEWKRGMRTTVWDSLHRFCMDSVIHGYHIYKDIWTSSIGEELHCQREVGIIHAVWVLKTICRHNTIVSHFPRQISTICLVFKKGRCHYMHCFW